MYRIMTVRSAREDYKSLYQFLTAEKNGEIAPLEVETLEELDVVVEDLLNNGYAKSDFIVIKLIDYTIDAKDYTGV